MISYAVARARGLRSHFLGRRGLYELAAQPELTGRLELLRRVGLVDGAATTLRAAERQLALGLRRDAARIDALLAGTRPRLLLRAVLAIGDAWTLKTILRGVAHSEPSASLLALAVPTFELDEAALKELVAQRTVKAVVDLLATWGSPNAAPLLSSVAAGHADLPALELAIDRVAYARAGAAAARAGGAVARLIGELVDLANAVTLLEVTGKSAGRELFLEGGRVLTRRRFERLAALPAAETRAALSSERALGLAPAFVDGAPDAFLVDRLVRRRPLESLRRASREQPLSVAVPLLYLLERQEEVRAVRTILEGAEIGLAARELVDLADPGGPS